MGVSKNLVRSILFALLVTRQVSAQPDTLAFSTKGGVVRLKLGTNAGFATWTLEDREARFGKPDRVYQQRKHKTVCRPGFCATKVQVHRGWFHYYDRMGIEVVSADNENIGAFVIQLDSTGHADAPTGFFTGTVVLNGQVIDNDALDSVKSTRPRISADVLHMDPLECGAECEVLHMEMTPQMTTGNGEYQLTADLPQGGVAVTFDDARAIRRLRIVRNGAPHRHFEPARGQGTMF